jgi:hypothetical protein
MRLTFLGKDSQPNNSPTLYAAATTDPAAIELCVTAFEAVWKLSIATRDYLPS